MNSMQDNGAASPRVATRQELSAMLEVIEKHDAAKQAQDYAALMSAFHTDVSCEIKPAGLRILSFDTLAEMYRRTLPQLRASFLARIKARQWSNQNGVLREWMYPVRLPSGEEKLTRQLEIFEFAGELRYVKTYRIRMNTLYSDRFVEALGKDYAALPGVERVPG